MNTSFFQIEEGIKNQFLLNYGNYLFYNEKLYEERYFGNVADKMWFYHLETLVRIKETPELIKEYLEYYIQDIFEDLGLPIEINNYCLLNLFDVVPRYSTVIQNNKEKKYNLDWHFDNRTVVTNPIQKIDKLKNLETIGVFKNKVYSLWDYKRRPKYTMIMYFNTYNSDFKGGEFKFIDDVIKPSYGDILFFNSNELHKVEPVIGKRNALVLKFYDIEKLMYDN